MRKIDINHKYRTAAIFCAVKGRGNNGKARISWEALKERLGVQWESYTHELTVKGMLHGGSGYVYLTKAWAAMTAAEQMEEIMKMYPKEYTVHKW